MYLFLPALRSVVRQVRYPTIAFSLPCLITDEERRWTPNRSFRPRKHSCHFVYSLFLQVANPNRAMSTVSSRSDYGSFEHIEMEHAAPHATNGGYPAPNSTYGGGGVNLPPSVRYPPSYLSSRQQYQ